MPMATASLGNRISLYRHNYEGVKRVVRQLAAGLDCLHSNGVLHLDLKPANILIYDNTVRIADFGLAKCYVRPLTFEEDYTEKITLDYRDIRILEGEITYDGGVDVWSLGVIALDCITGSRFFAVAAQQDRISIMIPSGVASIIKRHILTGEAYSSYSDTALVKMWKQIFARDVRSRLTANQVRVLLA